MSAVVGYLSGRDFETRTFRDEIAEESFSKLENALHQVTNQFNFNQFRLILASAEYEYKTFITSSNAVNFAYALFLRLRRDGYSSQKIQGLVRRWFVMSMLTGRHSGSFETQWDQDWRRMDQLGVDAALAAIETSELTDGFWSEGLPLALDSSSTRNPQFVAFLAAQNSRGARGFLSKYIKVANMIGDVGQGDVHHLFPKAFLAAHGINDRSEVNQTANYAIAETPLNIRIGKDAPATYMARVQAQIDGASLDIGEITDAADLALNLAENAVPELLFGAGASSYSVFLDARRRLMAAYIRSFYLHL